jgi:hypothetical protein
MFFKNFNLKTQKIVDKEVLFLFFIFFIKKKPHNFRG